MPRRSLPWAAAAAVALVLAPAATAARQPTLTERAALTAALPASFQNEPVGCIYLGITVSSTGRFAKVTPVYLNAQKTPCVKYAANGWWILKKTGGSWKIVFNGSDMPPCSLGVPKDVASACLKGQ
jgi:hypothetical protein